MARNQFPRERQKVTPNPSIQMSQDDDHESRKKSSYAERLEPNEWTRRRVSRADGHRCPSAVVKTRTLTVTAKASKQQPQVQQHLAAAAPAAAWKLSRLLRRLLTHFSCIIQRRVPLKSPSISPDALASRSSLHPSTNASNNLSTILSHPQVLSNWTWKTLERMGQRWQQNNTKQHKQNQMKR